MCIDAAAGAAKDEAERRQAIEIWEQKVDSIFDEILEARLNAMDGGPLGVDPGADFGGIVDEIDAAAADLRYRLRDLAARRERLIALAERVIAGIEWCDAELANTNSANTKLYAAYCYASGEIDCGFADKVPAGAIAFAAARRGPEWDDLWTTVTANARHGIGEDEMLVPGVPEAESQEAKGDALRAWIGACIPPAAYEAATQINRRSLEGAQ